MRLTTSLALAALLALGFSAAANKSPEKMKEKFQMMDTDKNGQISEAEHSAGAANHFSKMDTNGDQNISRAEMEAFMTQEKGKSARKAERKSEWKMENFDANGDGMVSAQEHADGMKAKFTQMDMDGNGAVTMAEMQMGHDKMKSKKR